MLKFVTLAMFVFFIKIAVADIGFLDCGIYEINGRIEKNHEGMGYFYYVNKGTKSQFKINIPFEFEPKITPYIRRPSKVNVVFKKTVKGYEGEFSNINTIELSSLDPLNLRGRKSITQLKKLECAK